MIYFDDKNDYLALEEIMSTEDSGLRMDKFINLCVANRFNLSSNAFDLDMIGYFRSFLEYKNGEINKESLMYKEISDYLQASGNIYSYRIDKLSEMAGKIIEDFKNFLNNQLINTDKDEDENNEESKEQKLKTRKLMITTADKLRNDSIDNFDPTIKEEISKFNPIELLFDSGRPFIYLTSLYNKSSIDKEVENYNNKINNTENSTYVLDDIQDKLNNMEICSDYCDFIADHDKFDDTKVVYCAENGFNISDHQFQNIDTDYSEMNNFIEQEFDTNINENVQNQKNETMLEELVECVDTNSGDYGFFNPKSLSGWNGPKKWKNRTIARSVKPYKYKSDQLSLPDDLDDANQNELIKNKSKGFQVTWLNFDDLKIYKENNIHCKQTINPKITSKWDSLSNICDLNSILIDIKLSFNCLEYIADILPGQMICEKNTNDKNEYPESSIQLSDYERVDDCDVNDCNEKFDIAYDVNDCNEKFDIAYDVNDCNEKFDIACDDHMSIGSDEQNENLPKIVKYDLKNEPNNDSVSDETSNEYAMDINILKKEMKEIIDSECVEIQSNSEFCSMPFSKLLSKLNVLNREELEIPTVYVGLLHLANELGLKLSQENITVDNVDEFYISKPIIKK